MELLTFSSRSILFLFCVTTGFVVLYFIQNYFTRGLHAIPGPFLAKFTDWWRLLSVRNGQHHHTAISLHRKLGSLVRLGPNYISISDPQAMDRIYGLNRGFQKSRFYEPHDTPKGAKRYPNLFSDRDEAHHAMMKKPIANAYSMSTLTEYEPFVDATITTMVARLEELFCGMDEKRKACDIAKWVQYYAFDVIAQITWSRQLGFLEHGKDMDDMIRKLEERTEYIATITQMPSLDYLLKKNPILTLLKVEPDRFAGFVRSLLRDRETGKDGFDGSHKDFLSRFLASKKTHPDIVRDDDTIVTYMISNIIAGSDTTAIALRSIIYFTLKHPDVKRKLIEETDRMKAADGSHVSWKSSQMRPYLDAVINESFRIFPAVGLGLERVVPAAGLTLPDANSTYIPPGTIVGMNAWVIHRAVSIFGPDPDTFNPSRWLQAADEQDMNFAERLGRMKRTLMYFGKGPRTCLGKNVTLLEVYKLIPTLFQNFELELAEPAKPWGVKNAWFVRQWGMDILLRKREF